MSALVASLPSPMDQPRRHKKMLRDGSGEVWPDHAEQLFTKAIQEYDRQSTLAQANSPYPPDLPSRNEFIVRYLQQAGLERTKQQVASHIQQLKKRSSKESSSSSSAGGTPGSSPAISFMHRPSFGSDNGMTDSYFSASTSQSTALPFGSSTPSTTTPQSQSSLVTAIAIRVNDAQPLQVPVQNLTQRPPQGQLNSGAATLTGVSQSAGLSIRIRLVVPPHQDALSHLASSRIFAIVTLSPNYVVQTTTLGNKISVNNMFLLEETDSFVVQGNQLYCPLRMSGQTSMMVSTQGPGLPITIQQTIYGGQTSLLKITYELIHPPMGQSMHNSNSMYQYPTSAVPAFTPTF